MQFGALHPESRAFMESWAAINGVDRNKIVPSDIARDDLSLLNRLFLAQRLAGDVFIFRTVGQDLTTWIGRDLRDHEIGSIFCGTDQVLIRALVESAIHAPGPALARACAFGVGPGQRCEIELGFLPLIEPGLADRVLGLFQPIGLSPTLSRPVLRLSLTALLPPAPVQPARPALRLVPKTDLE